MATGYTHAIHDGTEESFETFVIRVAKAFCPAIRANPEIWDIYRS